MSTFAEQKRRAAKMLLTLLSDKEREEVRLFQAYNPVAYEAAIQRYAEKYATPLATLQEDRAEAVRFDEATRWIDTGTSTLSKLKNRASEETLRALANAVETLREIIRTEEINRAEAAADQVRNAIERARESIRADDPPPSNQSAIKCPPPAEGGQRPGDKSSTPEVASISNDSLRVNFSTVANINASTSIKAHELPWAQLVEKLTHPAERPSKEACALLKLVTFGNQRNASGSLRHDANVREVHGLVGDYDSGEVSVEEAARTLEMAGVEAFIYTTPSHTPERPRWRVIAPLSKVRETRDYAALTDRLNGALGGILAPESWTRSQVFYFGRVLGTPYETRRTHGACIDLLDAIQPTGKNAPGGAKHLHRLGGRRVEALDQAERDQLPFSFTAEQMEDLESAALFLASKGHTEDYHSWINSLGFPLASLKATPFEPRASALWHKVSALSSKYNQSETEEKWGSFEPTSVTYKTVFSLAQDAGWTNPRKRIEPEGDRLRRTEFANAARLLARHGDDLMFVAELESWFRWDGRLWRSITHAEVEELAMHVVRDLLNEADKISDPDEQSAFIKFCASSRRATMVKNMATLASRERLVRASELDKATGLLAVGNGIVDLRTGELRPHDRTLRLTVGTVVNYDAAAEAPVWRQTLHDVFCGDEELVAFFQRLIGYALLGDPVEHILVIPYGSGSNGKSTLLGAIQSVLGGYARSAGAGTFTASGNGSSASSGPREDVLRLRGSRFVYVNEPDEGGELREDVIKSLASTDTIAARGVYAKHTVELRPSWVAFMPTNHQPIVKGDDHGIWRRLMLIPFTRNFDTDPEVSKDVDRGKKLRLEAGGVLRWCIEGALAYQREGLNPPESVREAREEYRREMDLLAEWLHERSEEGRDFEASSSDLWESWREWAEKRGLLRYISSSKSLGRRLATRFKRQKVGGRRGFVGLRLRPEPGFCDDGSDLA